MVSRRGILRQLAGLTGTVGLAGCTRLLGRADDPPDLGLPPNPHAEDVPERQHAQNEFTRTDSAGNPIPPRHHAVFLLTLDRQPTVEHARRAERAMRTLDGAYDWSSEGLFHALAWGTRYFSRIDALDRAPIERPEVLSRTDDPEIEEYDAALVLASDVPSQLVSVENAMFGDASTLAGESVDDRLGDVFTRADRRTGFIGEGLPAAHTDAEGIPSNPPLSEDAPMFMGFNSGLRGTQASEERVTISSGRFEGGTTMHLSRIRQSLSRWFEGLDEAGRVERMFSAEFDPADVQRFTDDVPVPEGADAARENARSHGVVGHQEKVARAREDGNPVILRRDFNTVDGGHVGVHFVSLQRSLDDFVSARKAMNGWWLRDESEGITDRKNNGILEFITFVSLANFYVPPRAERAFPLL